MQQNKTKITFLISDIDGTLLKGVTPIPQHVIDAANSFMTRGNLFSLCTGRSLEAAKEVYDMIKVNAPSILFGGALLYDFEKEEIVFQQTLDSSIKEVIEHIIREYEEISVSVSTVNYTYTLRSNETFSTKALLSDRHAPMIDSIPDEPLIKVLLTSLKPESISEMKELYIPVELFHAEFASKHFFEIVSSKVSKGKTIERLLQMTEGAEEMRIFGAGDSITDLSMIDYVDEFFAPSTALPEVLQKAHHIIPPPQEGGIIEVFDR